MKTLTIRLIVLLTLALAWAPLAHAQTQTACFTTLNGSITRDASTLVLTSTSTSTGCSFGSAAVGQALFMDGEPMNITAVSSTTMTVNRSVANRAAHYTGAVIFRANPAYFYRAEPPIAGNYLTGGNIVCTNYPAPWINVVTGNVWWCNTKNNVWSGTNFKNFVFNSVPTAQ
jgi:hypothetical protein